MRSNVDDPFRIADALIKDLDGYLILVDFHAEATSEKRALGYYLDGRVGAIWGTHTHVPTADAQILPHGTAYITDVGFTGPKQSVLGVDKEVIIQGFLTQLPVQFEVAGGEAEINGLVLESKGTDISSIQLFRRSVAF